MKASDHMLKPSENTLHQRGHPHESRSERPVNPFCQHGLSADKITQLAAKQMWLIGMKHSLIWGSIFLAAIEFVGPLKAEQAFPFLDQDAVRAAYDLARSGWKPAPDMVRQAFLVAEDKKFLDRPPVRSTITATITYWYPEPGSRRSFAVSAAIAGALSHDEILDWFVHGTFLGQGCFGVDGAAGAYFSKPASELKLQEAAFLAAIARAPAQLHPIRAHDRALARRNFVIQEMAEAGFVSALEASIAEASPLSVRVPLGRCSSDPE